MLTNVLEKIVIGEAVDENDLAQEIRRILLLYQQ